MRLTVLAVSGALALASCSQAPSESVSVELHDGETASVRINDDGLLCIDGGGLRKCGGNGPQADSSRFLSLALGQNRVSDEELPPGYVGQHIPIYLYGHVPAGATEIVGTTSEGRSLEALVGHGIWALPTSADFIPERVEARSASGNEVRTESTGNENDLEVARCAEQQGVTNAADQESLACYRDQQFSLPRVTN